MRPEFFDEIDIDTDGPFPPDPDFDRTIECSSRYIFVFDLFSEEEIKKDKNCEVYNGRIQQIVEQMFKSSETTDEYLISNRLSGSVKLDKLDKIIRYLENIKNKYNKTTKRIYLLDIEKGLKLVYAAHIAKDNIKNELQKVLYKFGEELFNDKKERGYKSIDSIQEAIQKQTHIETSSLDIENINSTIADIPQEAKDLVNIVANDDEFINNSFDITVRLDANNSFYRWYNFLLSQIKVYLVKEDDMPTMKEYIGKYKLKEDDIDNIIPQTSISKALGCYYNIAGKEVKICICPELIEDFADSIGIDKNIAYAKVIVHEFAHAMMDEHNLVSLDNDKPHLNTVKTVSNKLSFRNPYFRFVMEESVANCITLNKFNASSLENFDSVINDVIKFIEHQPDAYKFGIKQSNAKIKVCKWRALKDKIDENKADEWLKKYFENNEPYSTEAFDDLFVNK